MTDRSNDYLKAIKSNKVVAVGDKGTKQVEITGIGANVSIKTGDYKLAYDKTADKALSELASNPVDAVAFKTDPIKVTGVSLDKTSVTVEEGQSVQLTATVAPSNATDKSVTWKSGNDATATVDQNGKVTGVKAGTVNVVVTTKDGSKTATCTVTVTAKPTEPETPSEGE